MSNFNKKLIVAFNFVLVMGFFFFNVYKQERIKKESSSIILQLAPVDPRSLIQGDFMTLRFDIITTLENLDLKSEYKKGGYIIIDEDNEGISRLKEVSYNWQEGSIKFTKNLLEEYSIGADSYFFQEGKEKIYAQARYAKLYLDSKGNVKVEVLLDNNMEVIEVKD